MSISVEYCFNSGLSLPELAFEISRRLGCSLSPYEDEPERDFYGVLLGMRLRLWAMQDMVNARDLDFENYRYMLSIKTPAGSSMRPVQVETIALIAFLLHRALEIHQGMLSFEVSTLLARYDRIDGIWYDLVGNKPVAYPEHLVDIKARISDPEGSGLIA
jgi:hypothetical protein